MELPDCIIWARDNRLLLRCNTHRRLDTRNTTRVGVQVFHLLAYSPFTPHIMSSDATLVLPDTGIRPAALQHRQCTRLHSDRSEP